MSKLKHFQLQSNSNKLLTLDAVIKHLDDWVMENRNYQKAWLLMILHMDAMQEPLTLSQFIATDVDGKPLEEPSMDLIRASGTLTEGWDSVFARQTKAYKQAKANVIFEGLKTKQNSSDLIEHALYNDTFSISFYREYEGIRKIEMYMVKSNGWEVYNSCFVETFSDLAKATESNPLPLKKLK